MKIQRYNFDIIGNLFIIERNNKIVGIKKEIHDINKFMKIETKLIRETKNQIQEYLKGRRKKFNIPIEYMGTNFQKDVWEKLKEIPYGEVKTYKDIAISIKNPKAFRAVGNANNKNNLLIIVPCHRVVGENKKLGGFGAGIEIKKKLLKIEGIDIKTFKK